MPYLIRGNAQIYYEETGQGDPVIACHGLIENTLYWKQVAEGLSKRARFIATDMRGHGRTVVEGEPYGFDEKTVAEDVVALADHLGLSRFHLLTHSTSGFAAVRYAMRDCSRLASLILTNTGSTTSVISADPDSIRRFHDKFARSFELVDWPEMIAAIKLNPAPFFRGIMESERAEDLMDLCLGMVSLGNRSTIAAFIRSFYTDPDPMVEGLRRLTCPTLIVYGEKDDLFIESSRLMACEIPGARLIEYKGVGHMSALEAPGPLTRDIIEFIQAYPA